LRASGFNGDVLSCSVANGTVRPVEGFEEGAPSNPEGTSSHVSTTAEIAAKLGLLVAECMSFPASGRRSSLLTSLLNGAVSSSSDGDDMLCTVGGARLRTPCLIPGTSRNRSSSVTNGGSKFGTPCLDGYEHQSPMRTFRENLWHISRTWQISSASTKRIPSSIPRRLDLHLKGRDRIPAWRIGLHSWCVCIA